MTAIPGLSQVLAEFGLAGKAYPMEGGTARVFRCGDLVFKRIHNTSLENQRSLELIDWIAGFSSALPQAGFRIPLAHPTRQGTWRTTDNWTAWSYLEGRHAVPADIPQIIPAAQAYHRALASLPAHPAMQENPTPWGLADRGCWGEKPSFIQPRLRPLVDALYALRIPLPPFQSQLIHADLNPENILLAPGQPPAFLDLSPFWGSPNFALAIFANFIGPRQGDAGCLSYFKAIPHFTQLLVRAGIRMLLVMVAIDSLGDWETCSEKRAAELIVDYARSG